MAGVFAHDTIAKSCINYLPAVADVLAVSTRSMTFPVDGSTVVVLVANNG